MKLSLREWQLIVNQRSLPIFHHWKNRTILKSDSSLNRIFHRVEQTWMWIMSHDGLCVQVNLQLSKFMSEADSAIWLALVLTWKIQLNYRIKVIQEEIFVLSAVILIPLLDEIRPQKHFFPAIIGFYNRTRYRLCIPVLGYQR